MLDKVQVSHITSRVKDIYEERVAEIKKEFPHITVGNKKVSEWAEALKNGQVVINPAYLANAASYPQPFGVTSLGGYLMEVQSSEKKNIQEEKIKKLKTERDRILDELVLGDAQEAVKMLGKFREFKV